MALRPMLFVGWGGAGGITLRYLMDELRSVIVDAASRSRAHGGGAYEFTDRVLPQEWQFIHIDVPTSPDYLRREDPPPSHRLGRVT